MKRTRNSISISLLALALVVPVLASGPAGAHQVWVEQDGKQAKLYFGEFGDNLRESSPGRLDKFGTPTAHLLTPAGERQVPVSKTASAFVLQARAGKGESIVVEDPRYPIIERPAAGSDKKLRKHWTPAARHVTDFTGQAPKLALDVLPAGKPGELRVFFRGQPLPKAKVQFVTPSGWLREGHTDDDGKVSFPVPWKGTYLAAVHHEELKPGKRPGPKGDEAYDAASFSTTLSFTTRGGLPALPPPPPPPAN